MQDLLEAIQKNAEMVAQKLNLQFDEAAVHYLEGFIERQRETVKDSGYEGLVRTLGSFLGECILKNYGGTWQQDEEGHVFVSFGEKSAAYPFSKVRKQFENGLEDSVYSFYTVIPHLFNLHD